jgi:hypothetical protein
MTRIRDRYGVHIFRQFFEAIVERCQDDGLIWGKELSADATLVEANADRDNMLPRFALEAHLRQLFGASYEPPMSAASEAQDARASISAESSSVAEPPPRILKFPTDLPPEQLADLTTHNQERQDWYARNGEPDRSIKRGGDQRTSDLWVSLTDPDAVLMRQHTHGVHLRYRDQYLVDGGKARIILGVLVTAADVMENMPFLAMVWRAWFRFQLHPRSVAGDTTYGTVEIIRALEDAGIRAVVPITDWDKRTSLFGREAFIYDAEADHYTCPNGATLQWDRHDYVNQTHHYHADAASCNACRLKTKWSKSDEGRTIRRSFYQEYLDRVAAYHQTEGYKRPIRNARCGLSRCLVRASSGMGCGGFGYAGGRRSIARGS